MKILFVQCHKIPGSVLYVVCSVSRFASDTVSKFAQKLFAIPCGILAAALVFKGNQSAYMTTHDHKR